MAETRPSLPPRPGIPLRQDYEYRREGSRNLFFACEPLAGWRHVAVTRRRTMEDFAHQMRWLVDGTHPETPVMRVVMDNQNTHCPASLYETLRREVQALVKERSAAQATINWRFNTQDARTKLHRLYPFDSMVD